MTSAQTCYDVIFFSPINSEERGNWHLLVTHFSWLMRHQVQHLSKWTSDLENWVNTFLSTTYTSIHHACFANDYHVNSPFYNTLKVNPLIMAWCSSGKSTWVNRRMHSAFSAAVLRLLPVNRTMQLDKIPRRCVFTPDISSELLRLTTF